jgi:hypothetical protein
MRFEIVTTDMNIHGGHYDCCTVQSSGCIPVFQCNILPPSSEVDGLESVSRRIRPGRLAKQSHRMRRGDAACSLVKTNRRELFSGQERKLHFKIPYKQFSTLD